MEFDLLTGIVSIVIAGTSAVIIYFIYKVSMTSSSYDDIKASKRQEKNTQSTTTDQSMDAKKLKKMKKKLRKGSLKSANLQDTTETSSSDRAEASSLMEEEIESQSVAPLQVDPKPAPIVKPKTKNKPPKQKNRENEASEPVPHKNIDQKPIHKVEVEPNEVDLKSDDEIFLPDIGNKEVNGIMTNGTDSQKSLDDEIITSNEPANNKLKKKSKKKKTDSSGEDSGKTSLPSLLPLLKQAEFSHGEVQILIDALLNKDDSEWLKGKQDPMLKMKKQVMEMEKLHADDAETINGLQVKMSSLRTELNTEKSNNKGFRDALTKMNNDFQALTAKFQQTAEEYQSMHAHLQQLKQQLSEEQLFNVKLQEEKAIQQQMNIPHEQHHETVVALQTQVNQLATQLTDEQSINANLAAQLDESMRIEEDYRQVSALNVELDQLLINSQFETNRLNTEVLTLRGQVDDLSSMIEAIEALKNELMSENENLKVEISKASQDARTYQKMADTLEHNLQENQKNGNVNFSNDHSNCQSLLEEKEVEIKNLDLELTQKEKVIEKLTNDVINCKNEANKKQTLIENLNVELASLKTLGAKTSVELNEEKSTASNLRATVVEKTENIIKLTKEVESYKHRNNELRSKNWKVVEALEKAEASIKDLSSRINDAPTDVDSSGVASIKSRINRLMQPFISLSGSENNISSIEDNDVWLTKLEQIMNNINKEPKNEHILAQNAQLQNLVTHYRSVINDLEKMLLDLEVRIESANKEKFPEVDVDD